ncbi:MarR family winged helix-turn-helix transcriptional regulator [Streptomyces halstedii]|uniref:MarR family transcriptional regulator n=1 Tax=Streptomyces halstedii TaxID=1944 RepID=A0A6N9U3G2_STRHA|nr:MarR family transcriptional regulator [Streptomyces halstedii]NEA18340.1 MarR family transcriptional regulator [Streptomyces halstedii]
MTGSRAPSQDAHSQDIDHVASVLVACLPALHRGLERRIAREFPHPRLPDGQLALLFLVEEREGVTVRETAEALLMKPNNVSALVSQLTDLGLLERRQDTADKRVAHLYPTPLARERLAEARLLKQAYMARALRTLTDGDLDALGAALGALVSLPPRLHSPAG